MASLPQFASGQIALTVGVLPEFSSGQIALTVGELPEFNSGELAPAAAYGWMPRFVSGEGLPSSLTVVPVGGVTLGGCANIVGDPWIPLGGVTLGGAAAVGGYSVLWSQNYPLGGVTLGGAAAVSSGWNQFNPSGGVTLGGAATVSNANYAINSIAVLGSSAVCKTTFSASAVSTASIPSPAVGINFTWVTATSTGAFTTQGASPTIFWVVAGSTTNVTDGPVAQRLINATVIGSVILNGAIVGQASYQVSAVSMAQIISGMQFIQKFWDGWAVNLNTGAPSFYENFKFNSFARIGKDYYGCNDTGIYLLGAGDDAGAAINATITTGTSDLSTDRFDGDVRKTVPAVYVTAKSDQAMTLTCRVEGQEYTYTFNASRANMAPSRVDPGKGLVGTLWQFELKNQNGADFEIDSLKAIPHKTSRRV